MGEAILLHRGGGVDTSEANAQTKHVLIGKTFFGEESEELQVGTMPNNSVLNKTLKAGETLNIPQGFYEQNGKVTAETLANQTPGTATAAHILAGKKATVNGIVITGTMVDRGIVNQTLGINGTYTIQPGYYGNGTIKQSIATKAAQTYTPSTVNQTIAAGQYLSGVQTIAGSSNLTAANIKNGVNIFGVVGTYGTTAVKTTLTSLSTTRSNLAAGNIGDYVLFGGGTDNNSSNIVETYNVNNLSKGSSSTLNNFVSYPSAASSNKYCMFVGGAGVSNDYWTGRTQATAFDKNLVRVIPTESIARFYMGSGSLGGKAYFIAGATTSSNSSGSKTFWVYDDNLTRTSANMNTPKYDANVAQIGNKLAVFGSSGGTGGSSTILELIDSNLTVSNMSIPTAMSNGAAFNVGKYIVSVSRSGTVCLDSNLSIVSAPALTSRIWARGGNIGGILGVIAGGYTSSAISTVESLDANLVKRSLPNLGMATYNAGCVSTGDKFFYAGGQGTGGFSDKVEVYKLN